jgi:hypothetical protein
MEIQATYWGNPDGKCLDEIPHGGPSLRISKCAYDPPRLVEYDVYQRLGRHSVPVDLNPLP